ncbi:MAG: group II intron reverse transcriptase/maturase [Rickettsiaceae bacterium]|nr:group II intron reverse transcriptase/maturase [Rickettsiaceae bacterium]
MNKTKPYIISKPLVMTAYKLVKANSGAAGVDQQTLDDFNLNLKDNLYKIWNRMSSGTYFPPAILAVSIPKKGGGERILGIPTISDRIAQMVIKLTFEPLVEPYFHQDSYGYRPTKSALDAIGITRQRCWFKDWVLEFDIRGLFDNIDHELLLKAVGKHTNNKWVILYIKRWLKAPMQMPDGTCVERTKGISQGGVISPVLSNLFLHYVFDTWMSKNHPQIQWCRYADDGVVHCKTEEEATHLRNILEQRFIECKLELHPDKTKIIYCKDCWRTKDYPNTKFTFLGYDFRRRMVLNRKNGELFLRFTPAISKDALKSMYAEIRSYKIHRKSQHSLKAIANKLNPIVRGWFNYYGRYTPSALEGFKSYLHYRLVAWAMRKYKKLRGCKTKASKFIYRIKEENPCLFVHWRGRNVL